MLWTEIRRIIDVIINRVQFVQAVLNQEAKIFQRFKVE